MKRNEPKLNVYNVFFLLVTGAIRNTFLMCPSSDILFADLLDIAVCACVSALSSFH